jgi:hypothetical protein
VWIFVAMENFLRIDTLNFTIKSSQVTQVCSSHVFSLQAKELLTSGVRLLAMPGPTIPGMVANVFVTPRRMPAYLWRHFHRLTTGLCIYAAPFNKQPSYSQVVFGWNCMSQWNDLLN